MKTINNIREGIKFNLDPEQHFKGREVGMISASRGNLSPEVNSARNNELHTELKRRGFSTFKAMGNYTEETPTPHEVHEESHIVMSPKTGPDNGSLHATLMDLGKKYNQETIFHKPHNSEVASLHEPATGNSFKVGSLKMGIQGPNYTTLSNGKKFTFS